MSALKLIRFNFQITVSTTKSFIEYIKTQPIVFEVFGHYQQHPLHKDAKLEGSVRQPPRRMLPPSIPISQPVRSSKFGALPSPCTAHIHAKVDVLVWFEICELAPSGEYVPSVVEHSDDLPCRGLFLLHQVCLFSLIAVVIVNNFSIFYRVFNVEFVLL